MLYGDQNTYLWAGSLGNISGIYLRTRVGIHILPGDIWFTFCSQLTWPPDTSPCLSRCRLLPLGALIGPLIFLSWSPAFSPSPNLPSRATSSAWNLSRTTASAQVFFFSPLSSLYTAFPPSSRSSCPWSSAELSHPCPNQWANFR